MTLIDNELSEPYSIFTYRYFLRQWPHLCHMAFTPEGHCFGCVIAKMDIHRERAMRGYIGMLTVEKEFRGLGVGECNWRKFRCKCHIIIESIREHVLCCMGVAVVACTPIALQPDLICGD